MDTTEVASSAAPYDLVGVGLGPFNLSLAALADGVAELRTLFLDAKAEFSWHPGLMVEGATMQVPFLADLVSLVDPTSRWTFLAYLHEHDRLFPFYFAERSHLSRREYEHYCRWAAGRLPNCRFSSPVHAVTWDADSRLFRIGLPDGESVATRNIVLGIGTEPVVPAAFAELQGAGVAHHAEDYLSVRDTLADSTDVTVVGSGQSGAEVFLDLLRSRGQAPGRQLRWITRSRAIAPMEYSKMGLEHFTPDYTRYFHALPARTKDALVPAQWQLYKAASAETLADIHSALYDRTLGAAPADVEILPGTEVEAARRASSGGLELHCRHLQTGIGYTRRTDSVILATGHAARRPALLDPLGELVLRDDQGRLVVDLEHRIGLDAEVTGGIYVQNAELHTHGVGTPDLGLGAHRAATILNAVADRTVHRLPGRTAWTTFGVPRPSAPSAESASEAASGSAPATV
ncbi:SidA/IucD/PvdA family monooxygenase [Streptacidiphilus sp. N1-10]|uniref:L-lysine N6-monooxygenase MbtG n=1 Tax=Streptacidiphilus jeojiensis TaxID=3229225 RepID=A0ABV6XUW9_9ACTN